MNWDSMYLAEKRLINKLIILIQWNDKNNRDNNKKDESIGSFGLW